MNRFSLLLFLTFGGLCLEAQVTSTITISTNPAGARFTVDGNLYYSAVSFNWPEGSEHIVAFVTDPPLPGQTISTIQTSVDGRTQYAFSGWLDNQGLLEPATATVQVVTANPAVTTLTAEVTVSYELHVLYGISGSTSSPPVCGAPGALPAGVFEPGVIYIGAQCYYSSVVLFEAANSVITLNAYPYPGFVFTGWSLNSTTSNAFLTQFTLNGPVNLTPMFEPGKKVSFESSPPGLNLTIDDTTVPTRTVNDAPACPSTEVQAEQVQLGFPPICYGDFYFAPQSAHIIGGLSPQRDALGNWWVFSDWSNGQGQNATYQVPNNTLPTILTADYVAGAQVSFLTSPTRLHLTVDGESNLSSYNFIWGLGTTHQVSAPATQTGGNGRAYVFQNWSTGGNASSETYTVSQAAVSAGYRSTANYSELDRVVLQSSPSGLALQVDGASCVTPCNVDRQGGATFQVTAPGQISTGKGSRADFVSWSDGGTSTHTVTVSQNEVTITAVYNNFYQLSASSNPSKGSAFKFSPASSDGFYAQGAKVTVTAVPNLGFQFGDWSGALSGSHPSGTVTLSAPQSVVAEMITVPYIAPAGISNSAGQTPSSAVAPGSIISIFGQSLAPSTLVGPVNPLSQDLNGVTVTVNDLILPLLFVSPEQINAQLPSSLTPGNYTLEVQPTGQTEVSGNFTVARNAPGLFFQTINSVNYATAMHANGSLVTTASPAVAGETISLLGTGFGPYQKTVVDGFFPPSPPPAVEDSVVLSVGGVKLTSKTTAAPGYTGMDLTKFEVPSGLPSGKPAPLLVSINGEESNTVMLPVK
jgi:uncharacterized protein (TIGR03437 family)